MLASPFIRDCHICDVSMLRIAGLVRMDGSLSACMHTRMPTHQKTTAPWCVTPGHVS